MTFLRKLFDFQGRVVAPFLGRVDAQIGAALELSGDDNKLKRLETLDAAYDGEVGRMHGRPVLSSGADHDQVAGVVAG